MVHMSVRNGSYQRHTDQRCRLPNTDRAHGTSELKDLQCAVVNIALRIQLVMLYVGSSAVELDCQLPHWWEATVPREIPSRWHRMCILCPCAAFSAPEAVFTGPLHLLTTSDAQTVRRGLHQFLAAVTTRHRTPPNSEVKPPILFARRASASLPAWHQQLTGAGDRVANHSGGFYVVCVP